MTPGIRRGLDVARALLARDAVPPSFAVFVTVDDASIPLCPPGLRQAGGRGYSVRLRRARDVVATLRGARCMGSELADKINRATLEIDMAPDAKTLAIVFDDEADLIAVRVLTRKGAS